MAVVWRVAVGEGGDGNCGERVEGGGGAGHFGKDGGMGRGLEMGMLDNREREIWMCSQ